MDSLKNQALVREENLSTDQPAITDRKPPKQEEPLVLEEVHLEKITIDGICGVY